MIMFSIGFVVAWFLLGVFFYTREGSGGWSIWKNSWDTILMIFPAIPIILVVEIIQKEIHKNS